MGTHMLELDCHLTKDGLAVVCHDHNLLRATGQDAEICDLTYAELPLLKAELPLDFDPGK
jgi:glycerophosphoryl diester phosphodiesterase